MIVVKLKTPAGEPVCDIELPTTPAELPLARYVSFMNEVAKMQLSGNNIVMTMARAVAEFAGNPLDQILTAHFGAEYTQNESAIDGIRALYGWCIETIGKYKGELRNKDNCQFGHKGQVYEIPTLVIKSMGGNILPDIETAEAVEAFEVVRLFGDSIEKAASVQECVAAIRTNDDDKATYIKRLKALVPELAATNFEETTDEQFWQILEKHGDDNGDFVFSRYLHMMAILCRKPGEKLPWKPAERKRFINERAAVFQDIDTATGLDVDFFLLSTLAALRKNHQTVGSLSLQALGATVETRRLKGRLITGRSSIRKRSTKGLVGVR